MERNRVEDDGCPRPAVIPPLSVVAPQARDSRTTAIIARARAAPLYLMSKTWRCQPPSRARAQGRDKTGRREGGAKSIYIVQIRPNSSEVHAHTCQCSGAGKNPHRSVPAHDSTRESAPDRRSLELGVATPLAPGRRRARGAQRRGQAFTGRREGVRGRGGGGAEAGCGSESVSDVWGVQARARVGPRMWSAQVNAWVRAVRACVTHPKAVN